jgi:hypothetical protein
MVRKLVAKMRERATPGIRAARLSKPLSFALVTVAFVALGGAPASGSATAGSFHSEEPFAEWITNFPCAEGVEVLMSGVLTIDAHLTDAAPRHVTDVATATIDYRVDFGDGRYALGQVIDHHSFVINFQRPTQVETSAQQEDATIFASDGTVIETMRVHVTYHLTFSDLNGNFEPDDGEVRAAVERLTVSCG